VGRFVLATALIVTGNIAGALIGSYYGGMFGAILGVLPATTVGIIAAWRHNQQMRLLEDRTRPLTPHEQLLERHRKQDEHEREHRMEEIRTGRRRLE
jgi:hypothetical protein